MKMNASKTYQHGGTLLGFLGGLITGLAVAVVVAMYITKAPVPFSNHSTQAATGTEADSKDAQDPNQALYLKRPPAAEEDGKTPAGGTVRLLDNTQARAAQDKTLRQAQERVVYFLQLGAPKNESNAQGLRARTALLGEEARITETTVNGETLYRVRTGPYRSRDEMLDARKRLVENGFEPTEVKQTLVSD
ncbi:MAG: hypothetical protein EPO06_04190 [Burkholderiaceae bacterium]|nr:MAG: hypothetical protein EPO06_04190 [Burkholderiaceae bacterium]